MLERRQGAEPLRRNLKGQVGAVPSPDFRGLFAATWSVKCEHILAVVSLRPPGPARGPFAELCNPGRFTEWQIRGAAGTGAFNQQSVTDGTPLQKIRGLLSTLVIFPKLACGSAMSALWPSD